MSAPIGPGDWVERIDDNGADPRGTVRLVEGIDPLPGRCRTCGVQSSGIILRGAPMKWETSVAHCVNHWRPIYRRDEGLTQRLLRPVPAEPDLVSA